MVHEPVNLHLGCGRIYIPGFIHVDIAEFDHVEHQHDVRILPMFPTDYADLIYACHILEYFDLEEARDVLREWFRVLKPGGTIRLAVPDFNVLVSLYVENVDLGQIIGPLFGKWPTPGTDIVAYHRTTYDSYTLRALLREVGFIGVHRYDWRETVHKDYDDYSQAYIPHMDKDGGKLISLNMEGSKPL